MVDAKTLFKVPVSIFLIVPPFSHNSHNCFSSDPTSVFTPSGFHPYLLRVIAKLSLQGKDCQLQQGLIIAVELLLQDVFPKLQIKLMSCLAVPGKEMQE